MIQYFARISKWRHRQHPVLRRDPVFIVGMHRSGTSALGAALEALGLCVGKTVMDPDAETGNPKGYYENQAIVDLHDKFLTGISWEWHKPCPVPSRGFRRSIAQQCREEMLQLMVEQFGSNRPLIKDPRLCELLPLWRPLIDTYFSEATFILPVRSPAEVAFSLAKRDHFSLDHGLTLWAIHVLQAEKDSRGLNRIFTTYENLLDHSEELVSNLASQLNLPHQGVPAVIADRVDPALRNHTVIGFPVDHPHRELLVGIYDALVRNGPTMKKSLNRLRREYYKKMKFDR